MQILQWRKLLCDCDLSYSEQQRQEQQADAYNCQMQSHTANQQLLSAAGQRNTRSIFSFRHTQFRKYQQSGKARALQSKMTPYQAKQNLPDKGRFDMRLASPKAVCCNDCSTKIIFSRSQPNSNMAPSKDFCPNKIGALQKEEFVKQNRNNENISPQKILEKIPMQGTIRMMGKRLKTVEQQTDNSSRRSQIFFKTSEIIENNSNFTFQKNGGSSKFNNIVFQEKVQSLKTFSIPENNESSRTILEGLSPFSHENQMQFLMNARTIQTIVTPTRTLSRSPSKISNQLISLRAHKQTPSDSRQQQNGKYNAGNGHSCTISVTHNQNLSESIDHSKQMISQQSDQSFNQQNLKSGIFYTDKVKNQWVKSSKISVLDLNEQHNHIEYDDEEQLRDVIDSHVPFHHKPHSPNISINSSQKYVGENDKFQNKGNIFSHFSPDHSRQVSIEQLALLNKARANFQRTNTVESMHSYESFISYVDVKFMQQLRACPGQSFSRLV